MAAILSQPQCVNPSAAETRILLENKVIVMAADALAPYIARASTAMALSMKDE